MIDISTDSTRKNFIKYLDTLGLSAKTHKNYRSDLAYFINWLILRIRTLGSYVENLTEAVPFMNKDVLIEYKSDSIENSTPPKTINRRLSTLRHLTRFLLVSNLVASDIMLGIDNISEGKKIVQNTSNPVIDEFRTSLETEKVSKNTVKNYISDVRQFLSWLEKT